MTPSWVVGQSGLELNRVTRMKMTAREPCQLQQRKDFLRGLTRCSRKRDGVPKVWWCEQPSLFRGWEKVNWQTSRCGITWHWISVSPPGSVPWTCAHTCEIYFIPHSTWAHQTFPSMARSSLLCSCPFFSSSISVVSQVFALWLLKNYFAFSLLGTWGKKNRTWNSVVWT